MPPKKLQTGSVGSAISIVAHCYTGLQVYIWRHRAWTLSAALPFCAAAHPQAARKEEIIRFGGELSRGQDYRRAIGHALLHARNALHEKDRDATVDLELIERR